MRVDIRGYAFNLKVEQDYHSLVKMITTDKDSGNKENLDTIQLALEHAKKHNDSTDDDVLNQRYQKILALLRANRAKEKAPRTVITPTTTQNTSNPTKRNLLAEFCKADDLDRAAIEYRNQQFVPTEFQFNGKPEAKAIVLQLPHSFLPRTPLGYIWDVNATVPVVMKLRAFDDVNVMVKLYGPANRVDPRKNVNFNVTFNGINVQTYSNPRPAKNRYTGTRPSHTTGEFNVTYPNGIVISYDHGHGIPRADTISETHDSNKDPLNDIPEPSRWNQTLRMTAEGRFRNSNHAIMQYPYYSLHDNTYLGEAYNTATRSGKAVPKGVFFTSIDPTRTRFETMLDVSWYYDFDSIKKPKSNSAYYDGAIPLLTTDIVSLPRALYFHRTAPIASINSEISALSDVTFAIHDGVIRTVTQFPEERDGLIRGILRVAHELALKEYRTPFYKLFSAIMASEYHHTVVDAYLESAIQQAEFLVQLDDRRHLVTDYHMTLFSQKVKAACPGFNEERGDALKQFYQSSRTQ